MTIILVVIASAAKQSPRAVEKQFYVYILTNRHHTVLYTGVTSDLAARVHQHRTKAVRGFTSR